MVFVAMRLAAATTRRLALQVMTKAKVGANAPPGAIGVLRCHGISDSISVAALRQGAPVVIFHCHFRGMGRAQVSAAIPFAAAAIFVRADFVVRAMRFAPEFRRPRLARIKAARLGIAVTLSRFAAGAIATRRAWAHTGAVIQPGIVVPIAGLRIVPIIERTGIAGLIGHDRALLGKMQARRAGASTRKALPWFRLYSGMLSCFFQGFETVLPFRLRRAREMRRRVEWGMITSSI